MRTRLDLFAGLLATLRARTPPRAALVLWFSSPLYLGFHAGLPDCRFATPILPPGGSPRLRRPQFPSPRHGTRISSLARSRTAARARVYHLSCLRLVPFFAAARSVGSRAFTGGLPHNCCLTRVLPACFRAFDPLSLTPASFAFATFFGHGSLAYISFQRRPHRTYAGLYAFLFIYHTGYLSPDAHVYRGYIVAAFGLDGLPALDSLSLSGRVSPRLRIIALSGGGFAGGSTHTWFSSYTLRVCR